MIHLDILTNGYDNLLYLNGKSYNDIDDSWGECLLFLKDILAPEVDIKLRKTEADYNDFPKVIDVYSNTFRWQRIDLNKIPEYLSKRTIKWEDKENNKSFIIEPQDKLPDSLSMDVLTKGKWYVLME